MKKLVSLLLALTMIVSCTAALAAEDGKITIWTWDPNFNIAAMKVAKEMYAAVNPDVEVVIEEVLSEDIETRVITAASAGDLSNLPDIMLIQDNSAQKFVMSYPEVYTNITGKYDFEGFPAGKLAYSVIDGQNYGVPFDAGTVVGTYRTDFLEQAGYTVADLTDIDWDRFIEIGKDVKAKTGLPMLTGQAGAVDTILIMMQSCGTSMFNEDGSVNFTNNDKIVKVLEYYKTMVQEGIFVEVNTWDEYCGTLANSSCVGTINGCWILGTIMGVPEHAGKWALTNMPKMPGIEGAVNYSNNGGSSWVFTQGTDLDLALDFMQMYRNVDFYNAILPTTSAIGTWAGAKEGSNYTADNEYYGAPIFATIVEYTANVLPNQTGAYYYDARDALGTAVTNYLNGGDLMSELQSAEDEVNFAMGF
ncbi:MAG: carbohydrate ABC transporter substrate-binding protein [Clostridiales bacterium]|nr:carbohydrate ABC transporter substrate-binding protein [Clostridiales bacterium]